MSSYSVPPAMPAMSYQQCHRGYGMPMASAMYGTPMGPSAYPTGAMPSYPAPMMPMPYTPMGYDMGYGSGYSMGYTVGDYPRNDDLRAKCKDDRYCGRCSPKGEGFGNSYGMGYGNSYGMDYGGSAYGVMGMYSSGVPYAGMYPGSRLSSEFSLRRAIKKGVC